MNGSVLLGQRKGPAGKSRGATTAGCLLFLFLAAVLGFAGFRFGAAYWKYYHVREHLREVLTWAVAGQPKHETDIVKRVIARTGDEAGLYLNPKNIRITQTASTLTVSVFWVQDLDFLVYTYPMDFEASLTEIKRWGGRGLVIK
jgi:hypothetical protein